MTTMAAGLLISSIYLWKLLKSCQSASEASTNYNKAPNSIRLTENPSPLVQAFFDPATSAVRGHPVTMSVKLVYGKETKASCFAAERLGGFCYSRLNPTGKAYGDRVRTDSTKVQIDIAKYPPVTELNKDNPIEIMLDYGMVPVESKNVRDITVFNSKDSRAPMSQEFNMEPREELMEQYDNVFHILLLERLDYLPLINPQFQNKSNNNDTQFKFRVLFKPKLPAIAYTSTFLVWVGKIPIRLKCHGFSEGPYVTFSQNVLNFGGQYYGSESRIRIDMMNHSICEGHFQFDTDNYRCPFKICPIAGVIPPQTSLKLEVIFRPHKPQTYYKRVYCLLHQQNPQYLDVIGVCIPRPFFMENPIDFCVSAVDTRFLPLPSPSFEEYFQHDIWGIKISEDNFNFGRVMVNSLQSSSDTDNERQNARSFILTSTLPYDVLIEWVPDPTQIFHVTPPIAFLNAYQMLQFDIHFTPQLPETFFAGQLECYIYPTTLIWSPREGPPWIYIQRLARLKESQKVKPVTAFSEASYRSVLVEATEEDIANSSSNITPLPISTTPLPITTTTTTATTTGPPSSSDPVTTEYGSTHEPSAPAPTAENNFYTEEEGEGLRNSRQADDFAGSVASRDTGRLPNKNKKTKAEKAAKVKKSSRPATGGPGLKKKKDKDDRRTVTATTTTADEEEEESIDIFSSVGKSGVAPPEEDFGEIPFLITITNGENSSVHKIRALKHYHPEPIDPEPEPMLLPRCIGTSISPRLLTALEAEEEEDEDDAFPSEYTQSEDAHGKKGKKGSGKKKTKKGKKEEDNNEEEEFPRPSLESSAAESKSVRSDGTAQTPKSKGSRRSSESTGKSSKKSRKDSRRKSGGDGDALIPSAPAPTAASSSVPAPSDVEEEFEDLEDEFLMEYPEAFEEAEISEADHWDALLGCGDAPQLEKRTGSFQIPDRPAEAGDGPNELAIPLCLTIRVAGHTYSPQSQPPIPQVNFPSKVTMNPSLPQHREFRTFLMKNTSDLPAMYQINELGRKEIYAAKPLVGVIPGEGKQIVMISMDTKSPETAGYSESCIINLNINDDNQLTVFGYAEVPTLFVTLLSDASGTLNGIICPTTIPGYSTRAKMLMRNPSRFHYRFSIEVHPDYERVKDIFAPDPDQGVIAPYDTVEITWKFIPFDFRKYIIPWTIRLEVMGAKSKDSIWNALYDFEMPLVGEGSQCALTVQPKVLDFNFVEVFSTATSYFTVTNKGTSVVTATLIVKHEQWLEFYSKDQVALSPTYISLKAGEQIAIRTTVRPDKPVMYKYYVEYQLERDERTVLGGYESEGIPFALLWIHFMGTHSIAKVTDVQQIAAHPSWDTDQCWQMFSICELNRVMQPLQNTAKEGKLPKVPSVRFRFPAAVVGSPSAVIAINLSNDGGVDQQWQIFTQPPKNNKLYQLQQATQPESFSGINELTETPGFLTALWVEKYKDMYKAMKIRPVDESLTLAAVKNSENFKIFPCKGLNSSSQVINFKFSYVGEGEFRMPVLLRVYPAIFVWLELQGICLGQNHQNLQLMHCKEMKFHPISLNDLDPPIQTLWAYNGGNISTAFKVDLEPFKRHRGRNFGHFCFECLTPEGVALPKTWTAIKLRFSPIEFKNYEMYTRITYEEDGEEIKLIGSPSTSDDVHLRPPAQPHQTEIVDPFVPISISPNRVIFPHFIPTGDKATSVIFITNLSSKHSLSFAWPETTFVNSTSIKFLPDLGILAPKEQCACQVTVSAGGVNQLLKTSVRCWIEDISAIDEFNRLEKKWKVDMVEQSNKIMSIPIKKKKTKPPPPIPRPQRPKSCSRLLSISCYIGSSFGTLDNIWNKELSRMPFSDPIGVQPLPDEYSRKPMHLSSLNRHLSKEILRQVLWDIMMLSPNWPSYIRQITKREAVFYDDYKNSESSKEILEELRPMYRLPRKTKEDIVEFVTFTMLQEMADHYAGGDHDWAVLRPGALD